MRGDQEGCQRQGLRTISKPLKPWYGKTDEPEKTTLQGLPYVCPMKEALKGRRFSSNEEVIGTVQNWLKTQPKKLFFDGIKKPVKSWNWNTEVKEDYIGK
jgi:hypothetical protein